MQTNIPNRIAYRKLQLRRLVDDLNLPRQTERLLAVRLGADGIDLDAPMASLRQKKLAYMSLGLVTTIGALALVTPWVTRDFSGSRLLATFLSLIAFLSVRSARCACTEQWLRSHIARLALATELLGLAERNPNVRTYVECVVELFPWPSGMDVQIARKLAKQKGGTFVPAEVREAVAMQKLRHMPYLEDFPT